MKTVKAQPNQNVFDVAVQHYGNVEAVDEILLLNPDLENDPVALRELRIPIENKGKTPFYIDVAIKSGSIIRIDEQSALMNTHILRKINQSITTYETETSWQERLKPSKKK